MNNISFQGRTEILLSKKMYNTAETSARRSYANLNKDNCRSLLSGHSFTFEVPCDYLAVIVKNEKNGILKYLPVGKDIESKLLEITNFTDKLRKTAKHKLTAWIFGGSSIENNLGEETIKTLNKTADVLCDKSDIDASILVGTRNASESFAIHSVSDKLDLTINRNPVKNQSTTEYLENLFDIVELQNTNL